MFIETNERLVNLKNVSNINILDRSPGRIIFNMNYHIDILDKKINKNKLISDYVYWDASDREMFLDNLDQLEQNEYLKENFIKGLNGEFINKNLISSVKFSDDKERVIFNMSHPITFVNYKGEQKITSEFVYINCKNYNQYYDFVQTVKGELLGERHGN